MDTLIGLVPIFLQFFMFGPSLADHDIEVLTVEVPWEEASQRCEEIGYELLEPAVVKTETLVSHLNEMESYWTDGYRSRSPFYWKLGCYAVSDRSSLNMTDFGTENSIYQCSQKCGDLQFIGLEDTTCFCFPASVKLSQESKTPCTTLCPGNTNEICGESGSGKMSVYRKLDLAEDRMTLKGTTGDCVTLNKEDVDKLYDYYSYDEHELFTDIPCTEKRTFFCRNYMYDPIQVDSEIYIYNPHNLTYYEAQRHCLSNGNDLAYIDGTNALGVLVRDAIPVGSESWIGLFRETAELSIAEGDVSGDLVSCNSITIDSNVLIKNAQPCINKLKTLCMKATTEASVTEITESSTTEPTTTETATTEEETTELQTTEMSSIPSTEETTELPTTEMSSIPSTEETTELPFIFQTETTDASTTIAQGSGTLNHVVTTESATTTKSTTPRTTTTMVTSSVPTMTSTTETQELQPNVANVAEKKIGEDDNDNDNTSKDTGLLIILIALAVVLIIVIIIMAMMYKRYRRNRNYQKVNLMMVRPYVKSDSLTVGAETQTPSSPVKPPTPKKPARQTSMKQDKVLLDISQGNFVSQSDQFVPVTRDDVSWNLPFIDASRETLDNIDETQPVMTRRTIIVSESEANNLNQDQPSASVDLDAKVSQSHSQEETDELESNPLLKDDDEEEDDIFDDNIDSRLPRSPSERIDQLFRMSLSGEND